MNRDTTRTEITAEALVADVLKSWPQTIPVFIRHKTACVGCAMASFETLLDVSKNYEIPVEKLLLELNEAIQQGPWR